MEVSSNYQQPEARGLSVNLSISPPALEDRYWAKRCQSRLSSLDFLFELCNLVLWLSILPTLQGPERLLGKARTMVAVAQLVVMHTAPQLWLQHRTAILSTSQLLHCVLALPWRVAGTSTLTSADSTRLHTSTNFYSTVMVLLSGVWSHLLFVLFHQQRFTVQAPLLAVSTIIQAAFVLSRPIQVAGLVPLTNTLQRAFEHLVSGLIGNTSSPLGVSDLGQPLQTSVLTAVLFLHLFGSFLLPNYLTYLMEWKPKVSFLLCELSSQSDQLRVLTPAAAIVRGSTFLSGLLYGGWLLLMAVVSWVVCSTVAPAVANSLGLVFV